MNIRREIRGVCYVSCDSRAALRLMNICSHKGIRTWCERDVKKNRKKNGSKQNDSKWNGKAENFFIYSDDRKRLEEIADKCMIDIRIAEKKTLRTGLLGNRKRISILLGVLLFLLFVYWESGYVWYIEIDGCEDYTSEEIADLIEMEYPCYGHRKKSIDLSELTDMLTDNLGEICWASCSISGTKLTVALKESVDVFTVPEDGRPCDLVATMDCTIYSLVASAGTPVASVGDEVKKGDTLISGTVNIYNDDSEVVDTVFVPASGEIYGLCDVEYRDVVESELQEKETTDRKVNKVDIKIGHRVFTPYKTAASDGSYDLSAEEKRLHIGDMYFPLSVNIERKVFYKVNTRKLTDKEQKDRLNQHLHVYIGKMQEKGVQIVRKNVIITNERGEASAEGDISIRLPVAVPRYIDINNTSGSEEVEPD